jgi:predicted nucleic acid-binding protein
MNGRFFLDTNIFVYSFDASSPKKAAQARKLIRSAIETRTGIVSYQVVQEFFNVAQRRFSKPMSGIEAEQYTPRTLCMERRCGLAPDSSCLGTIR